MILMGYLQSIERFDIGKYSFPVSITQKKFHTKIFDPQKTSFSYH
jgi:hypothetical protein